MVSEKLPQKRLRRSSRPPGLPCTLRRPLLSPEKVNKSQTLEQYVSDASSSPEEARSQRPHRSVILLNYCHTTTCRTCQSSISTNGNTTRKIDTTRTSNTRWHASRGATSPLIDHTPTQSSPIIPTRIPYVVHYYYVRRHCDHAPLPYTCTQRADSR